MPYKHFIFDMGNVLVDFNPKYILSVYFKELSQINYYYHHFFKSGIWRKLDNGDIEFNDLIQKIQDSNSADKKQLVYFLRTWHHHLWERKEMTKIIKQLSEAGYSIHLCSNAPNTFYDYANEYSVFQYFESITISANHKVSKPNPALYKIVLKENNLVAKDCLFIDDLIQNIRAAEELGIDGYHYNGNELMFKKFLVNLNIIA